MRQKLIDVNLLESFKIKNDVVQVLRNCSVEVKLFEINDLIDKLT